VVNVQNVALILSIGVFHGEGGWLLTMELELVNRATAMAARKTILCGRYSHISDRDSD
jgi:hypothetical protein